MKEKRLDSIQTLRGVAALLVILLHFTFSFFPGAFGVDIFFVISGFIIMYTSGRSVKNFAIKRAIRILPLYFALTLFFFVECHILYRLGYKYVGDDLGLTRLTNSLLFSIGTGNPIIGAGWTMNLEIRFYFFFGISLFISHKHRAIICALMLILFMPDRIFLEFVYGMMAYYVINYLNEKITLNTVKRVLFGLISAAILAYFAFVSKTSYHEHIMLRRGIYYGIPAAVLFISFYMMLRDFSLPKAVTWLGNISFSVYLLHVPVQEMTLPILAKLNLYHVSSIPVSDLTTYWSIPADAVKNLLYATIIPLIITLILAQLSYVFIERRFSSYLRKTFIKDTNEQHS